MKKIILGLHFLVVFLLNSIAVEAFCSSNKLKPLDAKDMQPFHLERLEFEEEGNFTEIFEEALTNSIRNTKNTSRSPIYKKSAYALLLLAFNIPILENVRHISNSINELRVLNKECQQSKEIYCAYQQGGFMGDEKTCIDYSCLQDNQMQLSEYNKCRFDEICWNNSGNPFLMCHDKTCEVFKDKCTYFSTYGEGTFKGSQHYLELESTGKNFIYFFPFPVLFSVVSAQFLDDYFDIRDNRLDFLMN